MSWQKTALTHQKHRSLSDFFKHNTNRRIIYLKPWTSKWKCFSHIWSKWFWIIKKRGKILWNCICKLEKPLKNYKNHFWLGLVIGIAESDWAEFSAHVNTESQQRGNCRICENTSMCEWGVQMGFCRIM